MNRRAMFALIMATSACNDKDDKDVFVPPEVVPDDTAVEVDTEVDTPTPVRETGIRFVVTTQGRATVNADIEVEGYEATIFQWEDRDGNLSQPKCVFYTEMVDWGSDPARIQNDPLRDRLEDCPGCAFAFTASFGAQAAAGRVPWDADFTAADVDTDLYANPDDSDTDLNVDTSGRWLSCANLVGVGVLPAPDLSNSRWLGYGYKPSDADPMQGAWMIWVQNESSWAPYAGFGIDATFSGGVLEWQIDGPNAYDVPY